jgi:hypothetical protein
VHSIVRRERIAMDPTKPSHKSKGLLPLRPQPRRHEWRVVYRRRGWTQPQVRIFQVRYAALRFAEKLTRPYRGLEFIVELRVERRDVGPWVSDDEQVAS